MTFTILLSSAGRRVSLLRSLRHAATAAGLDARVIACDLGWTAPAMHLADAGFTVPRCTDPAFAAHVTELCDQEQVDLVVPTIDTELPVWATLKPDLATMGTTVAVSSPEAIAVAGDKRLTNRHCAESAIPCPRQAPLADVQRDASGWRLPLIVKPAGGSSSVGLHRVTTWAALDAIPADPGLVVEETAPGIEHTVDVLVDRDGHAHGPVVRRRLEVRAGEVSKAQVVRDDLLASLAVRTVETLPGAYGPMNVQIFSDGTTAAVIEINARFGGGCPLSFQSGGRHAEWLIREVARKEAPPAAPVIEYGLMMLRWDDEVFVRAD
ncbi:ATP-grasp domain-containing protein [Winogradskya humida]|uniref:Carbamoyl phosphate synthase large subunit n=1 Tax=Winogradskya humida TaxID=113566 RepID=A0ABQ3ZXW2_9ACTN|nr:ATP-grasp domain-containing protein [Actinoplanes humidus]GIE23425.1 carbamoyl phosphate synthase large subunit [Actinoplanes humidus]